MEGKIIRVFLILNSFSCYAKMYFCLLMVRMVYGLFVDSIFIIKDILFT